MGVEDDFAETVAILNKAIVRQRLECQFPKPRKLDESYRDKSLGDRHERVPEELDWPWVDIEMSSRTQSLHLRMPRYMGLLIESGQDKSVRNSVTKEERDAYFQCARLIINHFEFSNEDKPPVNDGIRLSIGIKANDRSSTAEFDDYSGLPAEWGKSVSKVLELSKVNPPARDPGPAPKTN